MSGYEELLRPTHCFCQIPDDELRAWVSKRYHQNCSTMELMQSTEDPHERELISIVAMLDVPDEVLLEVMCNAGMSDEHLIHCRSKAKAMLGL